MNLNFSKNTETCFAMKNFFFAFALFISLSTFAQSIDMGGTTRAVVIGISDYHPDSYRDAIPDLRFASKPKVPCQTLPQSRRFWLLLPC